MAATLAERESFSQSLLSAGRYDLSVTTSVTRIGWASAAVASLRQKGRRHGGARQAVIELLARQDCCLTAQEIFDDPQVAARRLMIEVPDPILGPVKLVGPVAKMSSSPEPLTGPAPLLGQHNEEVLKEILGYTNEQVSRLKVDGVI